MFPDPWLLTFVVAALLVVLGATSGLINERLWVSEPLACALAGISLGPVGFGLILADPASDASAASLLREAARITLAVAVTGAAMRLPAGWFRTLGRGLLVALLPGMMLMWIVGSAVAWWALGLPLLPALLVGAAIAPTDPVLSQPILSGGLAERAVPAPLRDGLTAESGANDGLALPLVLLPVMLMDEPSRSPWQGWLVDAWLWEVGAAVVVGFACGWVACRCLRWARQQPYVAQPSLLTVTIALGVASLAAVELIGADGVLAAFVAGAALNEGHRHDAVEQHHERFSEALARFFDLPVMVLFGAVLPWAAWSHLGLGGVAFALGVLILRRLPAWLLLHRTMPWTRRWRHALFAGWFGPVGAAALFYAMLAQDRTGIAEVWPAVSLAVAASVLAHGISATPLTWMFGLRESPDRFQAAQPTPPVVEG